jgi:hypothetical protein
MLFADGVKRVYEVLGLLTGLVLLIFAAGLAAIILIRIWTNKIDISKLICEPDGKASMSRLQLLIFTFVISLSLFFIVVGSGATQFPTLSPEILLLLGISSSTTLVSKAISGGTTAPAASQPPRPPAPEEGPAKAAAAAAGGPA